MSRVNSFDTSKPSTIASTGRLPLEAAWLREVEFYWPTAGRGFEWRREGSRWILRPIETPPDLPPITAVQPLEIDPPLFEALADCPREAQAIAVFAGKYGPLSLDDDKQSMGEWGKVIAEFQLMKLLFDHRDGLRCRKLAGYFHEGEFLAAFHDGKWLAVNERGTSGTMVIENLLDANGNAPEGADMVCSALERRLRLALEKGVTPLLRYERGKWRHYRKPSDLRAAAALQMAEALTGERTFVRCEAPDCQKYMDVTGSRSDKRMHERCSRRLRMRRWRSPNETP